MLKGAIALAVITACQGCAVKPYTIDIGSIINPASNTIQERYGVGVREQPDRVIRGRWGEFKGTIE